MVMGAAFTGRALFSIQTWGKSMKLGKLIAEHDERNLKLKSLLRAFEVPEEYDFDTIHPGVPTPMFANDQYGNCVIAGRAHQTLRFELIEQQKILPITDQEVIDQYLRETHGEDSGLVLLRSLRTWRRKGWEAGGGKYQCRAYAEIDHHNPNEVKAGIFADLGIGIGLSLPDNWQEAIDAGKPWSDTSFAPNPYNGHYVYILGYNATWLTCVTWGRKQPMTWAFFQRYCDEAYAIIDAQNTTKRKSLLDLGLLDKFLERVDEEREAEPDANAVPVTEPQRTDDPGAPEDYQEAGDELEADRQESGESKEDQAEHLEKGRGTRRRRRHDSHGSRSSAQQA